MDQELSQVREPLKLNGYKNSPITEVFNTSKIYNQQQVEEPFGESVDRTANQQYCSAPKYVQKLLINSFRTYFEDIQIE